MPGVYPTYKRVYVFFCVLSLSSSFQYYFSSIWGVCSFRRRINGYLVVYHGIHSICFLSKRTSASLNYCQKSCLFIFISKPNEDFDFDLCIVDSRDAMNFTLINYRKCLDVFGFLYRQCFLDSTTWTNSQNSPQNQNQKSSNKSNIKYLSIFSYLPLFCIIS